MRFGTFIIQHSSHKSDETMQNIDELIDEIIRQSPGASREEIKGRIAAKIEAVGPGYLTERGAAFLVAGEYGATIAKPIKSDVSIKDLYAGANEVTLEVRLLSVSSVRKFTQKDGGQGALRTMSVYDSPNHTASVKLWGDKATLPGISELSPGDYIRISKAYIKEDRDGSLAIHVGSGTDIEPVAEPRREIPSIESITMDVSKLPEMQGDGEGQASGMGASNLAVSGKLEGDITLMEYTRQQTGERATALKMRISGDDGVSRRVVLWGKDMSSVPKKIVSVSPKVVLLGVSARTTDQQQQQSMEIHGNDSTRIIIQDEGGADGSSMEPITIRILAKPPPSQTGRQAILGIDAMGTLYSVIDTDQISAAYNEGEIVECMPAQLHGANVVIDSSSFIRNAEGDVAASIPTLHEATTPITDARPDAGPSLYCINCIVINAPDTREIQTKGGEEIPLAEMVVADGSGEAVLKAWRNHARTLERCEMGGKYVITGVRAQRGMGEETDLTLTEYSVVRNVEDKGGAGSGGAGSGGAGSGGAGSGGA
ncbi:MAG: hypothetical protein OXK17_08095, partial [Thaumarchaeota archaeon]|nr:hypothetical protein [Nitrososphaerota archaeon]